MAAVRGGAAQRGSAPAGATPTSARPDTRDGERGAALVEYTLLLLFVVVVTIGALVYVGSATAQSFTNTDKVVHRYAP